MTGLCGYPVWVPTRKRTSDCAEPATHAAPLGATGGWLELCPLHRDRRRDAVRIEDVPA